MRSEWNKVYSNLAQLGTQPLATIIVIVIFLIRKFLLYI